MVDLKREEALTELMQMQCPICEAPKPTEREWAALSALTPAQAAGLAAGTHVVVPVKITDAMIDAWWDQEGENGHHGDAEKDWNAMLAAAQKEG